MVRTNAKIVQDAVLSTKLQITTQPVIVNVNMNAYRRLVRPLVFSAFCAVTLAACEGGVSMPVSPSAVAGGSSALNADGSTLKATAPNAIFPLPDATSIPVEAILTVQPAKGSQIVANFPHRFEVSDTDTFATLLSSGTGAADSQGLIRYSTSVLPAAKKVFWRSRAEQSDKYGPWSQVLAFTTVGASTTPTTPTTPADPNAPAVGPRPSDPPAGRRLPLPDARPFINAMSGQVATLPSCPYGRKYSSNPWLDKLVDSLRASDARWGYNSKPNRTAADNNGFPVTCAGDEIAYHYGAGDSLNSPNVYLIDALAGHCGPTPATTYRDFTGEEPGFWTLTRTPPR